MTELLQAAKAVIERWDTYSTVMDGRVIYELRAAVERAESQESVGFYEWLKTWHKTNRYEGRPLAPSEKTIWTAAQQAERERIKQIITYQFGDLVSDLSEVMEMIDE